MSNVKWLVSGLLVLGCKTVNLVGDCDSSSPDSFTGCVSAPGAKEHLLAFQQIAEANGGNRAAGTAGFDASVAYVVEQMTNAGYVVTLDEFVFSRFFRLGSSVVEDITAADSLTENTEFLVANFSGAGDVTANITAVDLQLGLGNTSNSGCEAADFAAFPAGNIALIQRGTCTFDQKVTNAEAAGAIAVLIMNQGNTAAADRNSAFSPSLSANVTSLPVVGTSTAIGEALSQSLPEMRVFTNVDTVDTTTNNVIAESVGGDPNRVITIGAHLDSVPAGPGINDDGSGSASILEIADKLANVNTNNKLRFIWWSAEELGLLGSFDYLENLPKDELDKIALYLNFDMVASPNFVREIYDGDGSSFGDAGPEGSDQIEILFEDFFAERGLGASSTGIFVPSDSTPFVLAGVPTGGLYTGASEEKTEADELLFGGVSNAPRDPCYHDGCDTIENINDEVLEQMVDAIGFSTLFFAQKTDATFFKSREARAHRPIQRPAYMTGCHGENLFQ
jgi:Zn-dependent M28 family amino/carboxypeptidase